MEPTGKVPRLVFPEGFTERDEWEMERKGFVYAFLACEDGRRYPVLFIDPVRLAQDVEATLQSGQPYYYEFGQVVVPEVTIPTLTQIIPHLVEEGYLERHLPLSEPAATAAEMRRSAVEETRFAALSRCSEEQMMNRQDEDPDWEAEAEAAEAAERRAEFLKNVAECHGKIQASHCLDLTTLPLGTRLVINTFGEFDPPIEITILEPASCKVSIKEQNGIAACIEGILLGCEDLKAITPGRPFPCKRVMLPGKLKLLCWLVYEVNGKRVDARSNTMRTIEILQPGMEKPFVLWAND